MEQWIRAERLIEHRWLFLDDEHIARMERLIRRVHPPELLSPEPVLRPEMPWESAIGNGSLHYDETRNCFRLWYYTTPGKRPGREKVTIDGESWLPNRSLVCYAESEDGITWQRPNLGQVNFEGSTDNNIVRIGHFNPEGISVLLDPDDPDHNRRYKALYWEHGSGGIVKRDDGLVLWGDGESDGVWVSYSPDGLHWTNEPTNPVIPVPSDTFHQLVIDPNTGHYIAYGRFGFFRTIARSESSDFVRWSRPELVLEPDDQELAGPYPISQFYGMTVDLYEGFYLGGLWVYREGVDGTIDTQLTTSRDGIHWNRVADRQSFLPMGRQGEWDDGMVRPMAKYIRRGENLYILYSVVNGPHAGPKFPGKSIVRNKLPSLSMGILRRDGFVSLDANSEGGFLLSKPVLLDGRPLHLNAEIRDGGDITITVETFEALNPQCSSEDIKANTLRHSQTIHSGSTDLVVIWREDNALPSMTGHVARLRIHLRSASLYSVWFE